MHWIDILILAIIILAAIKGYRTGAVRQLLSLLSWVISIALANRVVPYLAHYFTSLEEVQNIYWISWLLGFVLCMIVCGIASQIIAAVIGFSFGAVDHLLGLLFSVGVVVLLLGLLTSLYGWLVAQFGFPPLPAEAKSIELLNSLMETIMHDHLFEIRERGVEMKAAEIFRSM